MCLQSNYNCPPEETGFINVSNIKSFQGIRKQILKYTKIPPIYSGCVCMCTTISSFLKFCFEIFLFGLKGFNSAICHHTCESKQTCECIRFLAITLCFTLQSRELGKLEIHFKKSKSGLLNERIKIRKKI